MSTMANTTPLMTTVTKPATNLRDADATPRVNIQELCEVYYEDILPIIMDKVRRDRWKDVNTRLDFGEGPREKTREDSHHSSARARTTKPERVKVQDHLRYSDRHDPPRGRSRPHGLDTSKEDRPKDRERFHSVGESYGDSFSHSYHDGNRSRHMKRRRDNESPLSIVSRSDSSDRRYRRSRSKRHKSTDEDDLTRPWMCEEEDPFTPRIRNFESSRRTRIPNNVKTYDGTGDPEDHVKNFQAAAQVERWAMPTWCHMFNSTLIGAARVWFDELPPESIDSYKDLKAAFLAYFMQQKKYVKDPVEIHNIKRKDRETIEDFMERFKVETGRMKGAPECMRIFGFMYGVNNPELTKRLNEHVSKILEQMMITTTAFIRGEAAAASKKKGLASWKAHASSGTEGPLVMEAEIGGHMIYRMYVDDGSSMKIIYEHCFNRLRPEIKSQMVPTTTSLTGFSDETIWPLGQLRLLVIIGDDNHSTRAWMNFVIVRSLSPYNGIIGRSRIRAIQAVPSTVHGMLKFPVEEGIVTICSTVLVPTECTLVITSSTVSKEERTRLANFKVALHPDFLDQEVAIGGTLSDKRRTKLCSILKKNLDIFAWKPSDMTGVPQSVAEHRLNIREGYSPVRQKKRGQALERAKAIQAELTDVCRFYGFEQGMFAGLLPLPEIDWKVESLCGYPFKCFLDAYKGYHQIQLAEPDEEKTAFHTGQRVYCYTKMPFGLKNAGATYQRLMDKAFESQIGRNIEVRNVLGICSHPEGIKPCPDKTTYVLQLPSPRTIKEVQSLNGKLASLNRFLSKSAEKSLPIFQTLKKCIKKSNFHWTTEAKQAFKQLKQHLSELPLLVVPKPKEELIIYLSATYEAISAVLMTKRGMVQTPFYFISHALQGPELNYTPMEKLVLSLFSAAKRLRRYFQAHPITVITDHPIKQIISRPDVAGRLQKLSIMLGEHNITCRPRTSVKGQILADFLIEMPGENPQATPASETQQEPWTLFTDGSSSSNNEAEYEALIAGLWIAARMGVKNVHSQKLGQRIYHLFNKPSTGRRTQRQIHKREGGGNSDRGGRTDLDDTDKGLFKRRNSPRRQEGGKKAPHQSSTIRVNGGNSLQRSFLTPWLRCVGPLQAEYVIREIREGSCSMHAGPRSIVAKAIQLGYYWSTMHRDACDMIRKCNDCQIHRPITRSPQQPLTPITAPIPGEIVSDNGKQFSDNPFKDWCDKLNIIQRFVSVKHPQSNGLVERANRSLGEGIKSRLGERNRNWVDELPHVLWAHRTKIKSSHGDTPFSLTYGTEAVIPTKIGMPTYRTVAVDVVSNDEELRLNLDLLKERHERAAIYEAKAKSKMTKYYNARVRSVTFRQGDFVYRSNDASHAVADGNLGPKWKGPYEVTEALGDGAYKLRSMDETILPRTWNIANLKRCYL
uniref:Reverse transcriptase domain-containing protein n=1 Tax=Tanacetum cinerariifolium TaxID=118510 RepID=A0A6L2LAB5_TANCI|nr:reverse transcriptase domain-containing protein [Tanacetum cinerariifolium]